MLPGDQQEQDQDVPKTGGVSPPASAENSGVGAEGICSQTDLATTLPGDQQQHGTPGGVSTITAAGDRYLYRFSHIQQ